MKQHKDTAPPMERTLLRYSRGRVASGEAIRSRRLLLLKLGGLVLQVGRRSGQGIIEQQEIASTQLQKILEAEEVIAWRMRSC